MASGILFKEKLKKVQSRILQITDKKRKKEKKKLISFCKSLANDIKRQRVNIDNIPDSDEFAKELLKIQQDYSDWILYKK
jgi:hypothetical protein